MEINVRNKKTYKNNGYYIGRPSLLGNPFKITEGQTREKCIERYSYYIKNLIEKREEHVMKELESIFAGLVATGRVDLLCWCAPEPCHGDVIRRLIQNRYHTGFYLINGGICPTCSKPIGWVI